MSADVRAQSGAGRSEIAHRALAKVHAGLRRLAFELRERLTSRPGGRLLAIGLTVTLISCGLEILDIRNSWLLWEDFQLPFAPIVAALALVRSIRLGDGEHTRFKLILATSVGLIGVGQALAVVPDVAATPAPSVFRAAADICYVIGAVIGVTVLGWSLGGRLKGDARAVVLLDSAIIVFAGGAVVLASWLAHDPDVNAAGYDPNLVIETVSALFLASAGAAIMAALSQRIAPKLEGVWVLSLGMVMLYVAWVGWVARFIAGNPDSIEPMDVIFPIGAFVTAYGAMTWSLRPGGGVRYERMAQRASEWLPISSIAGCAVMDLLPHRSVSVIDPIAVLTALVILLAIARQRLLQRRERTAAERLANQMIERAAAAMALSRLEAGATVEETARRICHEALQIGGIDAVTVYAFGPSGAVVAAADGIASSSLEIGALVPPDIARDLRSHADMGLWLESWSERVARNSHDRALIEAGLRAEALAPLVWNDDIVGVLSVGAVSAAHARELGDRLTTLTEFSFMGAALLGPQLAEKWHRDELVASVQSIIDNGAFFPVFQPIVDLESGQNVGYEALTKFRDGTRPDLRFLAANKVGMMVKLEAATLRKQVAAARELPAGSFVSLNVSPDLVLTDGMLNPILAAADRPIVLEVTEHFEVDDYARLIGALGALRDQARIAVDDAGAGYAGLRHILELRAEYVKLDISLVRNIDSDPARQAMVAGISHFRAEVGCDLIAEGIETPEELEALLALGIRYGQGYFLCRPATADFFGDQAAPGDGPPARAA